jgi:MFS family permease
LVHSLAAVFIFRFITGFLSAIPTMVVAGSIEDIFDEERRTWIVYLWATVSNVGLVVGSVMATYISYSIGWLVVLI